MIEVAEKSVLWLRIQTSGKQCHASRPALGKNAFRAASHLVVRLDELGVIYHARDPLYEPPESTFEPTKKDANVPNVNTIPGEDVFYLDCRILPDYPVDTVLATIRGMADDIEKKFDVRIELMPVQKSDAPAPTAHDAPVVLALEEADPGCLRGARHGRKGSEGEPWPPFSGSTTTRRPSGRDTATWPTSPTSTA